MKVRSPARIVAYSGANGLAGVRITKLFRCLLVPMMLPVVACEPHTTLRDAASPAAGEETGADGSNLSDDAAAPLDGGEVDEGDAALADAGMVGTDMDGAATDSAVGVAVDAQQDATEPFPVEGGHAQQDAEMQDGANDAEPAASDASDASSGDAAGEGDGAIDATAPDAASHCPPDATPSCAALVQVSAGFNHTCGISTDGALYCWGSNRGGALGVGVPGEGLESMQPSASPLRVGTGQDWRSVAAGDSGTCGIRSGRLYCWGFNGAGQNGVGTTTDSTVPVQVGDASDWQSVARDINHTCGLRGGRLYCWGSNTLGPLRDNKVPLLTPTQVGQDSDWQHIATGADGTCGIRSGQLYCWGGTIGEASYGEVDRFWGPAPTQIGSETDWERVAVGMSVCGIRSGRLYCGRAPEVGSGAALEQIGSDSDWEEVATYESFSCGLRRGNLYCWGQNTYGQQGDGTFTSVSEPTQVGAATGWESVTLGWKNTCGVRAGRAYCWGGNDYAQLGIGYTDNDPRSPTRVARDCDWDSVSPGQGHTCGIRAGALYCWGYHRAEGPPEEYPIVSQSTVPVRIGNDVDWDIVSAGAAHTCGVRRGKLFCWGMNDYGALGDGTTTPRSIPTQVGTDADWVQVSAGRYFTCGIRGTALYCWGENLLGQVGDGAPTPSVLAPKRIGATAEWYSVAAGSMHVCGVQESGVFCWGGNNSGQLGDGTRDSSSTPKAVLGFDRQTVLAASGTGTCATRDGIYCWGNFSPRVQSRPIPGPVLVGPAAEWDVVRSGCAIREGRLFCWTLTLPGEYEIEQVGTMTDWTDVSVGSAICAIRAGALYCWGWARANSNGMFGIGDTLSPKAVVCPATLEGTSR